MYLEFADFVPVFIVSADNFIGIFSTGAGCYSLVEHMLKVANN